MTLRDVVEQYVASRQGAKSISTRAAAQAVSMILPVKDIVSQREFDDMVAEAALKKHLAVHFDAVA
ncbi:hypothetical protein [Tianweitania sediminis]|uniref:Uncharacterized protein n=1 Tax=Tianweitania sediminis TaxID=1502156 RepID=A0A8J7RIJ0_9HYPH|nr:hypothetical protein [Tianweitania sediminis]MBP0439046.1 hypothetical protein [Tianweitania sediminis]